MKKIVLGYLLFFTILFSLFFGNRVAFQINLKNFQYTNNDNITYAARTQGKKMQLYNKEQGWKDVYITGVNIGVTKPGYFPGEFGVEKEDYLRWFQYISEMNVNTIRVYAIQDPVFYEAFKEHNENSQQPLYLMHGVYLDEELTQESQDVFANDEKILKDFMKDIRNLVDIIHGNADVKASGGNAAGKYTADISPYVVGWILGIEWEPVWATTTNANHPELTSYKGKYIDAVDASPFEVFLAEAADEAVAYETKQYRQQRPLAMANWVTTDPLDHPGEPSPLDEDAVAIDVEHLKAKSSFEPGLFASYHVYPYYPDLFNYELKYQQDDPINTYAAYLKELHAHHTMPVIISEVGLPTSRGITHENIHSGFNQGHITEKEQGEMLTSLLTDIHQEGMAGALIFSWQDEWFKRTWNTEELDIAERRPFWSNVQTNEQDFGLLSFDPGEEKSVCYVDGDSKEWSDDDVVVKNGSYTLSMKSDEAYLYLMVKGGKKGEAAYIPLDTIPNQGNTFWEQTQMQFGNAVDFMLVLNGKNDSRLMVDAYYEPYYFLYGANTKVSLLPQNPKWEQKNSGEFVTCQMLVEKGLVAPETQQQVPTKLVETGKLKYGIANPEHKDYNSLADFYTKADVTEVRIPWLMLNVSDPAGKQIISNMYEPSGEQEFKIEHQTAPPFQVGIYTDGTKDTLKYGKYDWERWTEPTYHERLKQSYYILQEYFGGLHQTDLVTKVLSDIVYTVWSKFELFQLPIDPFLNYTIAFALSIIVYLFLILVFSRMKALHEQHRFSLREKEVRQALELEKYVTKASSKQSLITAGIKNPFSPGMLYFFGDLLSTADEEEKKELQELILRNNYLVYITKQLKTRDLGYRLFLIHLIGELRLTTFSYDIIKMLLKHKKNVDVQYETLLTLSLFGNLKNIVSVLAEPDFRILLSDNSLQEIFQSFTGNKKELYQELLHSTDEGVQKACILCIGTDQYHSLASAILPFLQNNDHEMIIAALNTLGLLQYKASAEWIQPMLYHRHWEVRAAAVHALANIDKALYRSQIMAALHDTEIQVRNEAAQILGLVATHRKEPASSDNNRHINTYQPSTKVLEPLHVVRDIKEGALR